MHYVSFKNISFRSDPEKFSESVTTFDFQFTGVIVSLLDRIAQMGRENYNERVLNLLSRLDFNGFYTRALDQFGCTA